MSLAKATRDCQVVPQNIVTGMPEVPCRCRLHEWQGFDKVIDFIRKLMCRVNTNASKGCRVNSISCAFHDGASVRACDLIFCLTLEAATMLM